MVDAAKVAGHRMSKNVTGLARRLLGRDRDRAAY
jgi:hypothetical protein